MTGRGLNKISGSGVYAGEPTLQDLWRQIGDVYVRAEPGKGRTRRRPSLPLSVCPAMILAQNDGMFPSVYRTAIPFGQSPLRVAPAIVPQSLLTAAMSLSLWTIVGRNIHDLLALIAGFMVPGGLIAGARQGFMVYFLRLIHGKFDGSNEHASFVRRVSPAISGTMPKTLEPAIKRCGR